MSTAVNRVPYRSLMSDNTRWDALELRPGDIIITTPSKCGMTWMQRLVSLLVFDGPDLPGPLSTVSPWFDQTIRPVQEVAAVLEAQRHRRFIKTHTPLDGLVLDDRVTYICVGRDPRDAAVSMLHQTTNMDRDRVRELYDAAAPATGRPGRPDRVPEPGHGPRGPVAEFRDWMEGPAHPPPGSAWRRPGASARWPTSSTSSESPGNAATRPTSRCSTMRTCRPTWWASCFCWRRRWASTSPVSARRSWPRMPRWMRCVRGPARSRRIPPTASGAATNASSGAAGAGVAAVLRFPRNAPLQPPHQPVGAAGSAGLGARGTPGV